MKNHEDMSSRPHGCPWCERQKADAMRVETIETPEGFEEVIVTVCPQHGKLMHDNGDDFCWCEK